MHLDPNRLVEAALEMVEAGAAVIDVGARSTAPYGTTAISEAEECERLERAIAVLVAKLPVPISADTTTARAARVALGAGARIVNDVSGLADAALASVVSEHDAGLILAASPAIEPAPARGEAGRPIQIVAGCLTQSLKRARAAGIAEGRIVVDPGIGFFREQSIPWDAWDAEVLANLAVLRDLGRPLCVGLSRKSFIGAITGRRSPADRLAGSLAATALAVWNGAAAIRTHDVADTVDAVRVAERLRDAALR